MEVRVEPEKDSSRDNEDVIAEKEKDNPTTNSSGPPWYVRWLAYVKNHGRVDPGKVELPHCDFFLTGQRRTLRVLRPPLGGRWFYEVQNDRPESLNDNFFARWSRRPHPSGNCRCSFRQSGRLSTNEEQIITAEINRIRNSLCEAEKKGEDMLEIERKLSLSLDGLVPVTSEPRSITTSLTSLENEGEKEFSGEVGAKNKIVRDLERYINDLLEEILADSVRIVADNERNKTGDSSSKENVLNAKNATNFDKFGNIKFAFHGADGTEVRNLDEVAPEEKGYANEAFLGSSNDPDALEFYLNRPLGKNGTRCHLSEHLDCVDSGINSVETVEFQPDQEPSLEESLMEIIDAKLGRTTHLRKNWEDFHDPEKKEDDEKKRNDEEKSDRGKSSPKEIRRRDEEKSSQRVIKEEELAENDSAKKSEKSIVEEESFLEDHTCEPSFEKLRLEFNEVSSPESVQLRRKTMANGKIVEREEDLEDSCSSVYPESPRDLVLSRKNRKPMIVFLHGYGSSADVFEQQLRYFSNLGYPCIAPELLGHGLSSAPNRPCDYHFDKLLKDLDIVLHHYAFRPGQKCVIVAHNYGCSFAAALACKYEANVHQLVLISGGGPTPLARPSAEGAAHCCLRAVVAPLLVCGLRREVMYSPRGRQHPYCGSEAPELRPSHMRYVLDGMDWPEGEYTFYRRICAPTLLIHGLRDNEVSLVQECQMERTMVKAFLEALPSAGHNPMTDCPDQLNHMIHCFIDLWKNKRW